MSSERTMTLNALLAELGEPPPVVPATPTGFWVTFAGPFCFLFGHRFIHDANTNTGQLIRTSYCSRCGNITVQKFL